MVRADVISFYLLTIAVLFSHLPRDVHFIIDDEATATSLKENLDLVVAAAQERLDDARVGALERHGSTVQVEALEPFSHAELDAILDRAAAYFACEGCDSAHHWADVCGPTMRLSVSPEWTSTVVGVLAFLGFDEEAPKSVLDSLVRPIFSCETCLDKFADSSDPDEQRHSLASDGLLWTEMVSSTFNFQKLRSLMAVCRRSLMRLRFTRGPSGTIWERVADAGLGSKVEDLE